MDALFVNPDSSAKAYQGLALTYSAIEPPTWALLLAESCRAKGFEVGILDCDAERLTLEQSVSRIADLKPKLTVMVVYGQNPNSGTTSMIGALALAKAIKEASLNTKVAFVGSHTSALPMEVLGYDSVDIVLLNEGVYALHNLLHSNLNGDLSNIKGIGYKKSGPAGFQIPTLNEPQDIVLMIGPEGGHSPEEEAQAQAAGYQIVSLGERVLRTETAGVVAITVVHSMWNPEIQKRLK